MWETIYTTMDSMSSLVNKTLSSYFMFEKTWHYCKKKYEICFDHFKIYLCNWNCKEGRKTVWGWIVKVFKLKGHFWNMIKIRICKKRIEIGVSVFEWIRSLDAYLVIYLRIVAHKIVFGIKWIWYCKGCGDQNDNTCFSSICWIDTFIQRTKKLYQDTRTQRNISKLNDELYEVHQIMTRNVQEVLGVGEKLDRKFLPWFLLDKYFVYYSNLFLRKLNLLFINCRGESNVKPPNIRYSHICW